jgi:hypothetical protein
MTTVSKTTLSTIAWTAILGMNCYAGGINHWPWLSVFLVALSAAFVAGNAATIVRRLEK